MRILLVGEFSRLHNTLKEGLIALGHDVTLISTGDGFKNYPSDILLSDPYKRGYSIFLKKILKRLLGLNITDLAIYKQFFKSKNQLKGFDVVQLMTEVPIDIHPKLLKKIVNFLKEHNKKVFVLAAGTDYLSVKHALEHPYEPSILTPYFEGKVSKNYYSYIFRYCKRAYKDYHFYVFERVNGVIASDLDYAIPLNGHTKFLGMVPNPVLAPPKGIKTQKPDGKVIIFHGINRFNYIKKGNDVFEKALAIIEEKYPTSAKIITSESLPYHQYVKMMEQAHIVLDMLYSKDQGYNALEAMAIGKVVFTGAGREWQNHYKIPPDTVAIHAENNVDILVNKLSFFIEDPSKIDELSKKATVFINEHHNYIKNAEKYLKLWQNN